MRIGILLLLAFITLTGCNTTTVGQIQTERRLEETEKAIDTDGPSTLPLHAVLYYPSEISLKFDGYIVGIEKSPKGKISTPSDLQKIQDVGGNEAGRKFADGNSTDRKRLFVSHIVKDYAIPQPDGTRQNCTIYTVYKEATSDYQPLSKPCPNESLTSSVETTSFFRSGWDALDKLGSSISDRIKNGSYTHILVITMGWNTQQEEAVRNFNSIVGNIKAASAKDFNPLVIGVTWPSQWESKWLPSGVKQTLGFGTMANDADELGQTWLGVLLNQTIPKADKDLPVVVIGHSFGSRAASVAACFGPAIYETEPTVFHADIDFLINYQGAFPASKFLSEQIGDANFLIGCENVRNFVLTSSIYDDAMNGRFLGSVYGGDTVNFDIYCGITGSINCMKAEASGHLIPKKYSISNVIYIDADDLIRENAYNTSGGAHSDIFRKEHGVMLSDLLTGNWNPDNQRLPDKQ